MSQDGQREPKGRPKGAQGLPKESKRKPKSAQGTPKALQRHPRKPKGKIYIKKSRSTAQADVMLYLYNISVYVSFATTAQNS